jgi:hypothetical protein
MLVVLSSLVVIMVLAAINEDAGRTIRLFKACMPWTPSIAAFYGARELLIKMSRFTGIVPIRHDYSTIRQRKRHNRCMADHHHDDGVVILFASQPFVLKLD